MNHWPTHVEVNVANIRHNVQQIRGRVGDAKYDTSMKK